jgi:tetratricopeptide (TPR) repeat protein
MRLILLLLAASVSAAANASIPGSDTALRGYVLGRYAQADDALDRAAGYFNAARGIDGQEIELTRRTFETAVAAGNSALAFDMARQLSNAGRRDSDIALVRLTEAVLKKDWPAADAYRSGIANAGYAIVVGPIVEAWMLYARGKTGAALARLDPGAFKGFARSYIAEQRAHMLAAAGRYAEAAAAYAELGSGTGNGISFLRQGEADARAQAGDREGAMKLLAGDDPALAVAQARLIAGKRIGALAPDPRRGIGWMAARLATDLSRDKPVPLALLFARMGTFLAPDVSATWLICGDVLARSGRNSTALLAYDQVSATDALAAAAAPRRAEVLEAMGRDAEVGALLRAATAAPGATADAWTGLGDWHRRNERLGDAAAAYDKAIAVAGPGAAGWNLFFLRGSMRERAGNWPAAEADLREALYRAPDEPTVLNYLGYSMLDRGGNPAEAARLIERAAKLRPGDGGIIDSLGWSHFRQGRFADAVAALEQAAMLEATDPTVADHLGDAYWQVGRRIEARFRWRAARDLDPSPALLKALQAKLDYGLDAALAMSGATTGTP